MQTAPHLDGTLLTWPTDGGRMTLSGQPGQLGGVDWQQATHLVLEVTGLESFNPTFTLIFLSGQTLESPSVFFNAGAIPGLRVRIAFPLDHLDSNRMFVPRTPGRLKQIVMGRGVSLDQVKAVILTMRKCHQEQRVILHQIYLSQGEPDYEIVAAAPLVDRLGQWKPKEWDGKLTSEEEMVSKLQAAYQKSAKISADPQLSRFGGDQAIQWQPTGYFRTQHDGQRWYLVDPDGHPFLSTGLDCCRYDEGGLISGLEKLFEELPDRHLYPEAYEGAETDQAIDGQYVNFIKANLIRAFGQDWQDQWTTLTRRRLSKWHFNTIGNWSDPAFIHAAKMPYVWPLRDFPETPDTIFRDFPDVFSPDYEASAEKFAQQLGEFAGDPNLIGYFLRNEPNWAFVQNLLIAEKVLENPAPSVCKDVFIDHLRQKYQTIGELNEAWQRQYSSFEDLRQPQLMMAAFSESARTDAIEFSKILIRQYVAVPSLACNAVDPHHLNLGMRYSMLTDEILLTGSEYFDVFSLNGYQESPYEEVQKAGELTGKPVVIGEFHFGAPDAGLPAAGICSVATQRDRGLAYRQYWQDGLRSPYFVGAHYFILYDQPVLGRFDGENMQIGLLDVCSQPYSECVEEMQATNQSVYDWAKGELPAEEIQVNRIPRLMGF